MVIYKRRTRVNHEEGVKFGLSVEDRGVDSRRICGLRHSAVSPAARDGDK